MISGRALNMVVRRQLKLIASSVRPYNGVNAAGMTMHDRTANGAVIPPPIKNPNFSKYQRRFPTIQYLRRGAQRRLPHFAYEYGDGGAGADTGIRHNWVALDAVQLVPRYGVVRRIP